MSRETYKSKSKHKKKIGKSKNKERKVKKKIHIPDKKSSTTRDKKFYIIDRPTTDRRSVTERKYVIDKKNAIDKKDKRCKKCNRVHCECFKTKTFKSKATMENLIVRSVRFVNCDNKIKVKTRIKK